MTSTVRSPHKLFVLAIAVGAAFAAPASFAAAPTVDARYLKERADCNAGHTGEDRATCLKEAGAALVERKRHTLDNSGSLSQNASERCDALPPKQKADCMARVDGPTTAGQRVTTSGSVAGGGTLTETTTTIPGRVIVVQPAAAAGSSASP